MITLRPSGCHGLDADIVFTDVVEAGPITGEGEGGDLAAAVGESPPDTQRPFQYMEALRSEVPVEVGVSPRRREMCWLAKLRRTGQRRSSGTDGSDRLRAA
jgi:hypothetical protein